MILCSDVDPFDPRLWIEDPHEFRIYLTEDLELYAIVDAIDYSPLVKYKWSSLGRKWKPGQRLDYARRTKTVFHAPDGEKYEHPITGKIVRNRHRTTNSVFLHHEIADRMGLIKPTPKHVLDHRNGRTLDCRRKNLRWVTRGFNTRNMNGAHLEDEPDDTLPYVELEGGIYAPN